MTNFHTISSDEALKITKSVLKGLSQSEVEKRLLEFGKNVLKEEKIDYLELFVRQVKNPIIYILFAAAVISIFIGDIKDFSVITLVIVINTLIGYWQELRAEVSTLALRKMTETQVTVMRNGKSQEIPSSDLVPGDIVTLREGDVIAADMRLLEVNMLQINESAITGESLPVEKNSQIVLSENAQVFELENMLLSGTVVVKGTGTAVVVKTGKDTYLASIAQKVLEKSPESPLTKALGRFSKKYLFVIFLLIGLIGSVMFYQKQPLSEIFYALLAVLVSAIPEGLPIVLTLSLAVGSVQLSKHSVLTRHLPAVETLGSTTLIATDKTGTITKGQLTVAEEYADDAKHLRLTASLANESSDGVNGDPLDVALARWVDKDFKKFRDGFPGSKIHPFDPVYKYVATTVIENNKKKTFIKGAFETLVRQSVNTEQQIKKFTLEHDKMARKGLRVLAFGQTVSTSTFSEWKIEIVGLVGFIDPPKAGVKEAVKAAQSAGVKIVMITGDNPLTAEAIAKQVNIFRKGDSVLTGSEIEKLSDHELEKKLQNTTVLARIVPEHKYRIVKLLQKREVVAMTGDGVNDVLALKAADLGIAMGSGTEAAKATAKMILLDDNLSVIVEAIRRGRVIADNIRKVIYYLVTTNLSQIFLIFFSILFNHPFPLKPIHILWINLVTDGVQDKTFPFIKEEGHVMQRPPQKITEMFFNHTQLKHILYGTVAIGLPNLILYLHMLGRYPSEVTSTTIFTSMVVAQWVNGIQAQKQTEPFFQNIHKSIFINPSIWLGVAAGILLQSAVIFWLHDWFETVPLSLAHFQLILITAGCVFALLECKKWVIYLLKKGDHTKGLALNYSYHLIAAFYFLISAFKK